MTKKSMQGTRAVAAALLTVMLALEPTGLPAQMPPSNWWPGQMPPPPSRHRFTSGALRHAFNAVHRQVGVARDTARNWGRQVGWARYPMENAPMDFQNTVYAFQGLRQRFNWAASQAMQQQRAGTANAMAELSSGLDIIAEVFGPVQAQLDAGVFDRHAILRMCRALDEALEVWDQQLTRRTARLNLAW